MGDSGSRAELDQRRKLARLILFKANRLSYYLANLIPRRNRQYFRFCYAYFRWVDDCIDDAAADGNDRRAFLSRQRQLLHDLYEGRSPAVCYEEALLEGLIKWDMRSKGGELRASLESMIEAVEFECDRGDSIQWHNVLQDQFKKELLSFLNIVSQCCDQSIAGGPPPGIEAAFGAKIIHIIRDLVSDLECGRVNLSSEELKVFRLTPELLRSQPASYRTRRWVSVTTRQAERQLAMGLVDAGSGNLRYRLIVAVLTARYQAYAWAIRRNRFDISSMMTMPRGAFVKFALRNCRILLSCKHAVPFENRQTEPAVRPIVSLPIQRRLAIAAGYFRAKRVVTKRAVGGVLTGTARSRKVVAKMVRRFSLAYLIGQYSCRFIATPKALAGSAMSSAGMLSAFWATAIIEYDVLIDDDLITVDDATALSKAWSSNIIHGSQVRPTAVRRTEVRCDLGAPDQHFNKAANGFVDAIGAYRDALQSHGLLDQPLDRFDKLFRASFGRFVRGQIESKAQENLESGLDWRRYCEDLLNQKTLGGFLAPLILYCYSDESDARRRKLSRIFRLLNSTYFHWQLIDDIADLRKDTQATIVSAPGYLLLSQGQLAREISGVLSAKGRVELRALQSLWQSVEASWLLCDVFLFAPLLDGHRTVIAGFLNSPAKCDAENARKAFAAALANRVSDFDSDLAALCYERARQADGYLGALQSGDADVAVAFVEESGACDRILQSAYSEVVAERAEKEIAAVSDFDMSTFLYCVERLIRKTLIKARTRHGGADRAV